MHGTPFYRLIKSFKRRNSLNTSDNVIIVQKNNGSFAIKFVNKFSDEYVKAVVDEGFFTPSINKHDRSENGTAIEIPSKVERNGQNTEDFDLKNQTDQSVNPSKFSRGNSSFADLIEMISSSPFLRAFSGSSAVNSSEINLDILNVTLQP